MIEGRCRRRLTNCRRDSQLSTTQMLASMSRNRHWLDQKHADGMDWSMLIKKAAIAGVLSWDMRGDKSGQRPWKSFGGTAGRCRRTERKDTGGSSADQMNQEWWSDRTSCRWLTLEDHLFKDFCKGYLPRATSRVGLRHNLDSTDHASKVV
jgi:hypothetical protein